MSGRTILQFPKALEIIKEYNHRTTQHRQRQIWMLGAFRVRCEKLLLASSLRPVGMHISMEQLSAYEGFLSEYISRNFTQICRPT